MLLETFVESEANERSMGRPTELQGVSWSIVNYCCVQKHRRNISKIMKYFAISKWYWLPYFVRLLQFCCSWAMVRRTRDKTIARLVIVELFAADKCFRNDTVELHGTKNRYSRTNALWTHGGWDEGIIHIAKWSKQTIHMFVHESDAMG